MKKVLIYSTYTIFCILIYSFNVLGQTYYKYSERLIHYQSKKFSAADINDVNQKIKAAALRKDTVEIIQCLIDRGVINQLLSKHEESLNSFYEAIDLSDQINSPSLKGNSYLGISNSFYRLSNNKNSLEYCLKAEQIFTETNDTTNLITAHLLMGQVLTDLQDFDRANALYKNILQTAQLRKDSITLAELYNQKGAMEFFQNEYENAISHYKSSLVINKALNNNINIIINYANIGEAYMYIGDTERALRYLFLAQETVSKTKFKSTQPFIYYTLAQTYSLLNQDDKAMEYFNKSIEMVNQISEIKEKPIIFLLLSDFYLKKGYHKKALDAYKEYVSEKDKLNTLSNRMLIHELKIKYDADKKERALQVMRAEKKLQEERIRLDAKRIKLQKIIIMLIVIILLFAIGFIVFFVRNQKKLRNAIQTKDMLFSIIAHDLRGPMGTIKQIVHTLDNCDDSRKDKFIKVLKGPTEKTYDLLEDLLTWSHSINRKLVNNPEVINISNLVNEIFELLTPQVNEKEIKFINSIPEDIAVKADKNQLSTIIRNLVVNAIKYNQIGGSIVVSHSIEQNRVKINIQDNGIGIDPQDIKKILSTNQFFTTYGTKEEKGTGLGLILAQNFIKKHGGKLEIRSELGKGSTFSFTLPHEKVS